jgi:hypothetical protein
MFVVSIAPGGALADRDPVPAAIKVPSGDNRIGAGSPEEAGSWMVSDQRGELAAIAVTVLVRFQGLPGSRRTWPTTVPEAAKVKSKT